MTKKIIIAVVCMSISITQTIDQVKSLYTTSNHNSSIINTYLILAYFTFHNSRLIKNANIAISVSDLLFSGFEQIQIILNDAKSK